MKRREFIGHTASGTAALWVGGRTLFAAERGDVAHAQTDVGRIYRIEHVPVALGFQSTKLTGLSDRLIQSHWAHNYTASVKTLNAVRKKLAEAAAASDAPPFVLNGLKREHLMRTGSVVLHELYFGNLGGNGVCGASLQKKIASDFGSYAAWELEFRKIAQGLGGGSGWVLLGYNYHFKTIENYWSSDHMHAPAGTVPLLAMDLYEHSYQIDYGAAVAQYIDAFFRNIQWEAVEDRLETAMKLK